MCKLPVLFSVGFGLSINNWVHVFYQAIPSRVTSLALGQSYDCPCASEVTLKDMGKVDQY